MAPYSAAQLSRAAARAGDVLKFIETTPSSNVSMKTMANRAPELLQTLAKTRRPQDRDALLAAPYLKLLKLISDILALTDEKEWDLAPAAAQPLAAQPLALVESAPFFKPTPTAAGAIHLLAGSSQNDVPFSQSSFDTVKNRLLWVVTCYWPVLLLIAMCTV